MYNSDMPTRAELPTTKQLIRSTLIALVAAIIILVTVILPAEYAIDPTGVGRAIGLTEMGEIKTQLAQEAAADQGHQEVVEIVRTPKVEATRNKEQSVPSNVEPNWRDKMLLSLKPGEGAEVKLVMEEGQVAQFKWVAKGGPVNFDTHGDGNGKSISYEKGRGVPDDQGELTAAFTGSHGWFFRNRNNDETVMVIIRAAGDYQKMKRVM